MSESLIIGFEDTAEGRDAVALGTQLAVALAATPLLANAVTLPEGVLSVQELDAALKAVAAGQLEAPLGGIKQLHPEAQAVAVSAGSAARALHDLAEQREAIATVVGSTDRGPLGRVLPGSTAERLLHGAPCAIAVAERGFAEQERRLLRVGVACDGTREADLALKAAVKIAGACNSTLDLLSIAQTVDLASVPAAVAMMPLSELQATEKRRMREKLDRALNQVPDELPAHGQLLIGAPGAALVDVSEEFDLIVVGSRGYGPLRRTLIGSTSRHLFSSAQCSVMAMPRGIDPGPFAVGD